MMKKHIYRTMKQNNSKMILNVERSFWIANYSTYVYRKDVTRQLFENDEL